MFGYDALRAEQKQRRERGDPVQLGIGVSTFTEMCGLAPSRVLGSLNYGAGGWEHATVRMLPTGKVEVDHRRERRTARATRRRSARSSPTGSACRSRTSRSCTATPRSRTRAWTPTARGRSWSAARRWCWPPTRSSRRPSRSRRTCSRPTSTTSSSAAAASRSRAPTRAWAIAEVALATFAAHNYPEGMEPGIDAEATYDPVNFSFPHGTHLCAVEVDTETGQVEAAQVRLRRRHRQHHQPADRGGPGARRPGPGHRAGAVGGGGVRRLRDAGQRLVRRLPAADLGRHDQLRDRPHDAARRPPTRSAPRASARRAPSPRRRPW